MRALSEIVAAPKILTHPFLNKTPKKQTAKNIGMVEPATNSPMPRGNNFTADTTPNIARRPNSNIEKITTGGRFTIIAPFNEAIEKTDSERSPALGS
jgi:hypothetical protein